ncbi:zinc-dependent metalloprotease [Streptomyces sp. IB2014 016-6]|uniref:zinc-dependent metalloprotease n=1 Tax=Streptomyces sp. IB2014 016-6 TaxID=2517818 RepID=UPI0011C8034F|nr:zinc-dependent metalloprotease [Streptomyces sp. IB2014 016-6]TXL83952.1 hypothetical protein EW053_35910 [Streptomyces sp. IB2014 016-6]
MTFCDIRHEAGAEADALVARIAGIAEQVVPVLEEVTDLPVGPGAVIRILTPDAWAVAQAMHLARGTQRDITDLDLTPEQIEQCRNRARATAEEARLVWPLVMGSTVEAMDGTPHVLLVPEALGHCGVEEPELFKVIAHELNRIAQHRAGDGAAFLAQSTAFPALRGLKGVMAPYFLSGHSRWADLKVTTRLLGREVNEDTGWQSETYRHLKQQQVREHYSGPQAKAAAPGPARAAYVDGAQWIRTVVNRVGTGAVNRAWKDTTLMPTWAETADPDAWIARVAS